MPCKWYQPLCLEEPTPQQATTNPTNWISNTVAQQELAARRAPENDSIKPPKAPEIAPSGAGLAKKAATNAYKAGHQQVADPRFTAVGDLDGSWNGRAANNVNRNDNGSPNSASTTLVAAKDQVLTVAHGSVKRTGGGGYKSTGVSATGGGGDGLRETKISVASERVTQTDKDGQVVTGQGGGFSVGRDGASKSGSVTRNGHTADAALKVGPDGASATGCITLKSSLGVCIDGNVGDGTGFGATVKTKYGSLGASRKVWNDDSSVAYAEQDARGINGEIARTFGEPVVAYDLKNGHAGGINAETPGKVLSIGARIHEHDISLVTMFRSADLELEMLDRSLLAKVAAKYKGLFGISPSDVDAITDRKSFRQMVKRYPYIFKDYMDARYKKKMASIDSVRDLDFAGMLPREGMSFLSDEGAGADGSIGAMGIRASLGVDNQNVEQTIVTRTPDGKLRVQMIATDRETLKGGMDLVGVLGLNSPNTERNVTSIAFEADPKNPRAMAALVRYQQTGLLPGAERAGGSGKLQAAIERYQVTEKTLLAIDQDIAAAFMPPTMAEWLGGDGFDNHVEVGPAEAASDSALEQRKKALQAELYKRSAKVNGALLADRKWRLDDLDVDGIRYTSYTSTNEIDNTNKLDLFGFTLTPFGTLRSETDEQYRQHGKTQLGYQGNEHNSFFFADSSTSTIHMNPKESDFNGLEIEQLMEARQAMNGRERDVLTRLPSPAMDRENLVQYANGRWMDDAQAQIRVGMTGSQMSFMHKRLAEPTDVHARSAASSATGWMEHYDRILAGEDDTPQLGFGPNIAGVKAALIRGNGGNYVDAFVARQIEDTANTSDGKAAVRNEMIARIRNVRSIQHFLALTEHEQGMMLASGAVSKASHRPGNPWQLLDLVAAINDEDQRNRHFRTIFMAYETATDGAFAVPAFIEHLQDRCEEKGVSEENREWLFRGVHVQLVDGQVASNAKKINKKGTSEAATAEWILDQMDDYGDQFEASYRKQRGLGEWWEDSWSGHTNYNADHMDQRIPQDAVVRTLNWLQAAERAGGSQLVKRVLDARGLGDRFNLWRVMNDAKTIDPTRAAVIARIIDRAKASGQ
jgi:hypothetical protein